MKKKNMFFDYSHTKRLELPHGYRKEYYQRYLNGLKEGGYTITPTDDPTKIGWFYDRHSQKVWYENGEVHIEYFDMKDEVEFFKYIFKMSEVKILSREDRKTIIKAANLGIISHKQKNEYLYNDSSRKSLINMHRRSLQTCKRFKEFLEGKQEE